MEVGVGSGRVVEKSGSEETVLVITGAWMGMEKDSTVLQAPTQLVEEA